MPTTIHLPPSPRGLLRWMLRVDGRSLQPDALSEAARAWMLAAAFPELPGRVLLDLSKARDVNAAIEVLAAAGYQLPAEPGASGPDVDQGAG